MSWIKKETDMPSIKEIVLVYGNFNNGEQYKCAYYDDGYWWNGDDSLDGVSHWRYLPARPTEKK